ncbi:hypothetical protein B5P44_06570 [Mycobacterium sp. CBMA 213]|nr:hypothetical protein [Mycolicibacterium sp. CBMA 213]MUM04446.1 hypothetical protein [Mycolicibacterium sp. CBMA 213]
MHTCDMTDIGEFVHPTEAGWPPDYLSVAASWSVAHRGYSGNRRLDVWLYRDERTAWRGAAELAMSCGMDTDATAATEFRKGNFEGVVNRYVEQSPDWHILAVQEAPFMLSPETFCPYSISP